MQFHIDPFWIGFAAGIIITIIVEAALFYLALIWVRD